MELRIESLAGTDIEIQHELPESLQRLRLPMSQATTATCGFGTMVFQQIKGSGWSAWKSRYLISHAATITARSDEAIIELHTAQKNNFIYHWEGIREPALKALQFNLSYTPHINNRAWLAEKHDYETFDFHVSRGMLIDYADAYPEVGSFLEKVDKKQAASLGSESILSGKMQNMLWEMEEFYCRPGIYLQMMEARIEAFIGEALEILCVKKTIKKIIITMDLQEKAMEAKRILDRRLSNPPSIAELAKLCMSNSFSIQAAFKEVFSMNIDDYSKQARMDYAKRLLLDTDWDLDSIADETGYHDGASFSRFFKKRFGCTPGEFRKYGNKRN
jgi:AraC family transcriptional regulator, transcriptional activator of the genes for pyochelin and ferripyochelin receptors